MDQDRGIPHPFEKVGTRPRQLVQEFAMGRTADAGSVIGVADGIEAAFGQQHGAGGQRVARCHGVEEVLHGGGDGFFV